MIQKDEFIILVLFILLFSLLAPQLHAYEVSETQLQKLEILCENYKTERAQALQSLTACKEELRKARASTENLKSYSERLETEIEQTEKENEKIKAALSNWRTAAITLGCILAFLMVVLFIALKF